MMFITDENTLNALVSIFIVLCSAYERKILAAQDQSGEIKPITNLALQEFLDRDSFYREKLLHLANRTHLYRFDKCLDTISIILSKEASEEFFNINDLNLLLDICLREIQRQKHASTRAQILRMIDTIISHHMYKKYPHKVGDVKQTIHELILYEDDMDGGGYSLKEKEYIAKLNLKFQVLNYLN